MARNTIRLIAAGVVAGSLLLTAGASAQDRTRRAADDVTEHTFTDADQIVGDTPSNQGLRVMIRLPNETRSLIRYRTHFRDSLLKSVEIL